MSTELRDNYRMRKIFDNKEVALSVHKELKNRWALN